MTEVLNRPQALSLKRLLLVGFIWGVISAVICWKFASDQQQAVHAFKWALVFSLLCLLDLYALGKAVGYILGLSAGSIENRSIAIIQTFYWGTLKLACLGILVALLARGDDIPKLGMLTGLGTLTVVPLLGGVYFNRQSQFLRTRELPHA